MYTTTDLLRVLVCDDDLQSRVLVCIMLSRAGFEPIRCTTAAAALAMLGDDTFELLVTELDLSPMDGISLIQEVRRNENVQNIPILLMVQKKDIALVKMALDEGATGFIVKPVMYHPFVIMVRQMLTPPIAY